MTKLVETLTSDKFFVLMTFSTMICYGMFWTIPGSLIYEIKTNINEGLQVFGYLMMILRLGKTVGHLIAVKVCGSVKPTNYPDIHVVSMAIQCLGVVFMPFCTSWALLAICWTIIGMTLGVVETNNVFLNEAVNHKSAPKYTNFYYFAFSLGASLTSPLVDLTKRVIDNPKLELIAVCGIVGGLNFIMNFFIATILKMRRDRGITVGEAAEFVQDNPTSFRSPIISNISLTLTSSLFMCGRTIMELFLLPYARYADANLSEGTSYSLVQTVFISTMIIRLAGVFFSPWLAKEINTWLLIFWNFSLVLGIISMFTFQDRSFAGLIVTMIIYGLVFGSYQNTLLNWMTDRLAVNPWNTAPFFFGTCLGSSITPAVIPHLIKNADGSINVDSFQIILEVIFFLTVTFCGLLMLAEFLAEKSELNAVSTVEVINLMPGNIKKTRFNSFNSESVGSLMAINATESSSPDSIVEKPGASKSLLSILSRRLSQSKTVSSLGHYTPMI